MLIIIRFLLLVAVTALWFSNTCTTAFSIGSTTNCRSRELQVPVGIPASNGVTRRCINVPVHDCVAHCTKPLDSTFPSIFYNNNRIKMYGLIIYAAIVQNPMSAWAEDDYVIADLPPPWIPVAFGLGLIVGVGLLTKSLGDVIDDESRLGMQSGARAKKEIERSRSSYFKKK
jgi:hypothetical protein